MFAFHRVLIFLLACCALCSDTLADQSRLVVNPTSSESWQPVEETRRPTLFVTASVAPAVDGKLNDPCWTNARKIDTFIHVKSVPDEASRWVVIQAAYDETHLYLAGRLAKPGDTLRATVTEQGGRIWQDDALEVFLYDRQLGVRYQIDVNALGAWWAGSKQTWTPQLAAAARIGEQGWTVELAIPWRDLNFSSPGERPLGIQFRYLVNGQSGSVSWVDAEREQTKAYGDVALMAASDDAHARDAGGLQVLRHFQNGELPSGRSPKAAGVELFNPTQVKQSANIRLSHVSLAASRQAKPTASLDAQQTVQVPPGECRVVTLDGVIPSSASGVIRQTIRVHEVVSGTNRPGKRLFQRTRSVSTMPDFRMRFERERFYYGDKSVAGSLFVGLPHEVFASASLHVEFGTRRRILSEASYDRIPSRRLSLSLDLSGLEPGAYQVIATLKSGEQVIERLMPVVIEQAMAMPARHRIPLRVNLPEQWGGDRRTSRIPLYAGVSFPGGTLGNLQNVRVVSGDGVEVPAQMEALAHWSPQGSIRWAGVHFIGRPDVDYFVEFGSEVKRSPVDGPRIRIERTPQAIRIDTGVARFDVPRAGSLLGDAWLGDRQALVGGSPCLIVADQHGHTATELGGPAEESSRVETEGPLHTVIRREGFLRREDGSTLGKYIVRLFFNAGTSFVRVQHSFINTEDTMKVQYSDLALRVKPAFSGPWYARLDHSSAPDDKAFKVQLAPARGESAYMTQTVYRHHGQKNQQYVIGVHRNGQWEEAQKGEACGQWASVSHISGNIGVAMTLRHFVETFPSELEIGSDGLTAHLWSSRGGRLLDYRPSTLVDYFGREWFDSGSRRSSAAWKTGAEGMGALRGSAAGTARTHDLSIHLFAGEPDHDAVHRVAHLTDEPPLALQDPAWLRKTEALGPLHPYDPERFPRAEQFIESFFRYFLVGQAEHWGNYGFLDHGSGPHSFDVGSHDYREHPYPLLKRTFQFDYKFRSTPWRMYARSGDRMYFAYGDAKNRHLADFRWVHHPARGLRHGAMILSEISFTLPLYWAGHEALGFQGQDIDNFIYQYYLTGDRWAHETVQHFGEYMAQHFDPRTTRPAGDMYNYQPYMFLASLYEMTWDERLGDKLRAMRWTLDPQTTTGFIDWPTMGAWYKWYIELFGPLRDYMVTGSHEARTTFLKLARLYITHAPAGRHMTGDDMGYDDNYGLAMNLAWQLTGDDRFAAHAREMFSRRLFWFSDESGQTHRVGPYMSAHSPQGLDTLAFLMDLVERMPDATAPYPAVQISDSSDDMEVYFIKDKNRPIQLDLLCGEDFDISLTHLLDSGDAHRRLGTFEVNMRPAHTASDPAASTNASYAELLLPKEALPGQYRLQDIGEVVWTDVEKIVVVAPEGLALPAASDAPSSWYFMIPAGKSGAIHVDQPVILERAGQRRELSADTWHQLEGTAKDQLVGVTPARRAYESFPFREGRGYTLMPRFIKGAVLLKFRGDIPPVLAQHDPERFFLPEHILRN